MPDAAAAWPVHERVIAKPPRRGERLIRADARETKTRQPDNPDHAHSHAGQAHEDRLEPATGTVRPRDVRICLTGLPMAAVCLAGLTVACSGQNPADDTLTGHLHGAGGPAPGPPRPWPGTVTLTGTGVHRDVPVDASGTYPVMVPAGRYTVVSHSPLYSSGTGLRRAVGVATVTSRHTTKAD